MEEYRVEVKTLKFKTNNEFKFTNMINQTKYCLISSKTHIEDPYRYICDWLKKNIESDVEEVYIKISKKESD